MEFRVHLPSLILPQEYGMTLVASNLEVDKSWNEQLLGARITVQSKVYTLIPLCCTVSDSFTKAKRRFPVLASYEEDWVTVDLMTKCLKAAKQALRRRETNTLT